MQDILRNLPERGLALFVGGADQGKTTALTLAARALALDGLRTAVIDADTGQSEIGVPGTVGVAWAEGETERLSDLKVAREFFVGALAPGTASLEHVVAAGQAALWARQHEARVILMDTPGFVRGLAARRFLTALAQTVVPSVVVAFAEEDERSDLFPLLTASTGAPLVRLTPSLRVQRKPPNLRATRRNARFVKAFEKPSEVDLPLDTTPLLGAALGLGTLQPPHIAEECSEMLHLPILRAQRFENTLTLWTDRFPLPTGWESRAAFLQQRYGVARVHLLSLPLYTGLFLGLHDHKGRLLSVAQMTGLDAERNELHCLSTRPLTAIQVGLVLAGRFRLNADQTLHSEVRPGEV